MPQSTADKHLAEYRQKRDFSKTPEPAGAEESVATEGAPRFVVQKHAASQLHFDLRLEMEGVMRSWAVPKGPSMNPGVRRLAMEVEDHPISYNDFEGIIPEDEYGGGTVMLWDRGTYTPDEMRPGESPEDAAVREYNEGKLAITFHGERLQGSFVLVRTDAVEGGIRSKWLLIKHRDEHADSRSDITKAATTSVASDRTMEEIAAGKGGKRVWKSNRTKPALEKESGKRARLDDFSSLRPMLARSTTSVPAGSGWTFEPKFDGIRVLAFATGRSVVLLTRNGRDKAGQFPEIVEAMRDLVEELGVPVVLDGEIVALENGKIGRFGLLQGRMHVQSASRVRDLAEEQPAALMVFDVLLRDREILVDKPWTDRRKILEEVLEGRQSDHLRLTETTTDHAALKRRGKREGWEGIMAKRMDSKYQPGERTDHWLKLKLHNQQELVIGGWTEPRNSRPYLGAILLGYYDEEGKFRYAGHTGTGFSNEMLQELHRRLERIERKTPPFEERPKTNEKPHWTSPQVVAEIKFNEWTRDGKLRQPVFLGIRDDKDPKEVRREVVEPPPNNDGSHTEAAAAPAEGKGGTSSEDRSPVVKELDTPVARRIRKLREGSGEGELKVGSGISIAVTSLEKTFFPKTGHTKGDLFTYYALMANRILPWMRDRPLVLKRFPNGVDEESFYQQAAPDNVPDGVRVETLEIGGKKQRRLVGGNLATLLYTIQLGAISYDPWHSRVQSLEFADYTILDLDPGPGATFQNVVQVARRVKEEMDGLGLHGALKTSGSSGIHIYLPLPPRTPLESATLIARIVATRVAERYPREATVERLTRKRPKGTVYVDFLQNILGKTVAGVYAVRAKPRPTVSTPLTWDELTDELDLGAFTIDTVPERVARLGDVWGPAMKKPISFKKLLKEEG